MRHSLILASVALLGLAACSDNATSKPTTSSGAPETTAAVVDTTAITDETVEATIVDETVVETFPDDTFPDETFPADTADPSAPGYGTPFCQANDELNNSSSPLNGAEPDPAEVEAFFTITFPDAMAKLIATAPPELADDIALLAEGIKQLTTLLKQHAWDFNATLNDPAMAEVLNNDAFNTAGNNVDEYCGTGA